MKKNRILPFLLASTLFLTSTGCGNQPSTLDNVTQKPNQQSVTQKTPDETFQTSQMNFALDLFQETVARDKGDDILVSPLSVMLALSMTANGAKGNTLTEMEQVLGQTLTIEDLNSYLSSYVSSLPSEDDYKLHIANSIWFRDSPNFSVKDEFLQTNADYYQADIFQSAFDKQTVRQINNWVSQNTDRMIDEIVEKIDSTHVMYLINALSFDAKWQTPYNNYDVQKGKFTAIDNEIESVEMMSSIENFYLEDENVTGFIKDYKDGAYRFVALLPNENVNIYDYIAGLSEESLLQTLKNAKNLSVSATLPKFSYDYDVKLNDILKRLGITTAFDKKLADFSNLGSSDFGNLYIGNVLHKTFISVDELGTKAGAATSVEIKAEGALMIDKVVELNRPFVYMILDGETNLPIFIGTVMEID